ncbi:MAG: DNA-processing protein DprA [Brevinema sp.]
MDTIDALIAFSTTDTIGHIRLRKIRQMYPKVEDFFNLSPGEMAFFLGAFSDRAVSELSSMKERGQRAREICDQKNIQILPIGHPSYPSLLKTIPDPPFILYARGTLENQIPLAAVIGTRKSTPEAEDINRWFCEAFAQHGIGVVSGLAHGHDSVAAQTIVQNEGYTVAVMGTAIDVIYPVSATNLYRKILETGAIISEYPPGTVGTKWRFPRRNRIVSGMAQAVFVVQAPEKSGTMITVKTALEQGRDVYSAPGNPMLEVNKGSNKLIQLGAKIAYSPDEFIKEILRDTPEQEIKRFVKKPSQDSESNSKPDMDLSSLSKDEQEILKEAGNWIQADELMRAVGMDASVFNAATTMLEIQGYLMQKPGRLYKRSEP